MDKVLKEIGELFHIANVFTDLMMKGRLIAAVHWITQRTSKDGKLDASTLCWEWFQDQKVMMYM